MELIQTKDYLLFIDEEAESKEFSYYLDSTNKVSRRGSNKYGQGFDDVEKMIYCNHIHKDDKIIIAYRTLTEEAKELDLPLLPNPFKVTKSVEYLAEEKADEECQIDSSLDYAGFYKGFILGYKAAQSKQFSLEDIEKVIHIMAENYTKPISKRIGKTEIIQSLLTQKLPKEFIPDLRKIVKHHKDINNIPIEKLLKTITNSEGKQEIVGTYKY